MSREDIIEAISETAENKIENEADVKEKKAIGDKEVAEAIKTLEEYRSAKESLSNKIIENEQWYKMRHWEQMKDVSDTSEQCKHASAWLFNVIANKHADAMDCFPEPNILPRERNDIEEAENLSNIIPVILEQCKYKKTYSKGTNYKLKNGTSVYGVFWNKEKHNGLGDIEIKNIDILNLFWQPGITDIQDSRNVFLIQLVDNDILKAEYPEIDNNFGGETIEVKKYIFDDAINTDDKSVVIDWYYKKKIGTKTVLHYAKICNNTLLYATENETEPDEEGKEPLSVRGWYEHGEYPFVFDVLFPVEGTPAGFGYIDVGKSSQKYIDLLGSNILKNSFVNTMPRTLVDDSAGIDEEEYNDTTKGVIHCKTIDGTKPLPQAGLSPVYLTIYREKIDELKETTGNRDVSSGGTTSGVTAAAAIGAMQEAGSKLSRDSTQQSYFAFEEIVYLIIELIREFYSTPRSFRITGKSGNEDFTNYSNEKLQIQETLENDGTKSLRLPVFDIKVTAQKQNPYSKMSQNELALQLYNGGFFMPDNAIAARACLEMMDFNHKDFVIDKINENDSFMKQFYQMQMQLASIYEALSGQSANIETETNQSQGQRMVNSQASQNEGIIEKAKSEVAESIQPF